MRQALMSALAVLMCAATAYGHDANADVMTIETRITFPGKDAIVLTHRANHLGAGETLGKLVAGTLGMAYPGGSITTPVKLSGGSATVAPGEHRFFIGNEEGKMFIQFGGNARQGGGTRVPMTLSESSEMLDHLQITVNHGDGDSDLKIVFAYGKYRSTVVLQVA